MSHQQSPQVARNQLTQAAAQPASTGQVGASSAAYLPQTHGQNHQHRCTHHNQPHVPVQHHVVLSVPPIGMNIPPIAASATPFGLAESNNAVISTSKTSPKHGDTNQNSGAAVANAIQQEAVGGAAKENNTAGRNPPRFVAMFNYSARDVEDLYFRKGDLLQILNAR